MELLIVDDNPTDRMVMRSRMQHAFPDVSVLMAGEASELNESLRRDNCDVVITDYWLGWGDGLSVLQRVRKKWPRCKVIFLTGNGGEEVVAEAFKYGLYHYLLKPDGFESLVAVTRTALDAKRREDHLLTLSMVLNSVPDAVFSLDSAHSVTSWNRAAEGLFGYPAAEFIGREIDNLPQTASRPELRRQVSRALEGERVASFELTCVRRDGAKIAVEMTLAPITGEGTRVSGVACVSRERTKASQRVARTQ